MKLADTTAIVTGATGGLGRFICAALAAHGCRLVLADLPSTPLETVADALRAEGVRCATVAGDLTDAAYREHLITAAGDRFGSLDVLVNNAGLGHWASFQDEPLADLRHVVETNLIAPLDLARLALPGMLERERGRIVMISSMVGEKGLPFEATYAATKAGLIQWSTALRLELEGTGVGVSVVCPGYVSRVGMFARHGRPAPRRARAISAERVATAVARAITQEKAEVLVWPYPPRPLLVLDAISPTIGDRLVRWMGIGRLNASIAAEDARRGRYRRMRDATSLGDHPTGAGPNT
jgi:short-subunit dehydrogenase